MLSTDTRITHEFISELADIVTSPEASSNTEAMIAQYQNKVVKVLGKETLDDRKLTTLLDLDVRKEIIRRNEAQIDELAKQIKADKPESNETPIQSADEG